MPGSASGVPLTKTNVISHSRGISAISSGPSECGSGADSIIICVNWSFLMYDLQIMGLIPYVESDQARGVLSMPSVTRTPSVSPIVILACDGYVGIKLGVTSLENLFSSL